MTCLPGGLVLGTCAWGLIVWRVTQLRKPDGGHVFSVRRALGPNEPKPWFFLPLVALDTVKVAETKVLSPVAFARTFQDATVASKILFDKPAPSEDVLKLAARQGFKMMNAHWLEKLYCHLKITSEGRRPTRQKDFAIALIQHVFPEATDEFIAEALSCRNRTTLDENSVVGLEHNMECIEHSIDEDDNDVLKKTIKAAKEQAQQKRAESALDKPPAAKPPAQPPQGPKKPRVMRPLPVQDDWVMAHARVFLPQIKGCSLNRDVKRFSRWTGTYSGKPSPPFSVSKSWGPTTGYTVHTSLVFVLKQLWLWHGDVSQEQCPFQLEALSAHGLLD